MSKVTYKLSSRATAARKAWEASTDDVHSVVRVDRRIHRAEVKALRRSMIEEARYS